MTEIRKRPLLGTRSFLYAIMLDGVTIYEQVGPFSQNEIEQRIAAHLGGPTNYGFSVPEFVPGARGTAKSYGSKGGKAGRRPKAAAGAEPWEPSGEDD